MLGTLAYVDSIYLSKYAELIADNFDTVRVKYETESHHVVPNFHKLGIQPFITYVSVQSPGQYSDSYELRILPIKGDPEFPRRVEFHGYTADDVRDEINRYKKNFERVDEDYSYYEEY